MAAADYFSPEQCIFRLRNAALRAAAAAGGGGGGESAAAAAAVAKGGVGGSTAASAGAAAAGGGGGAAPAAAAGGGEGGGAGASLQQQQLMAAAAAAAGRDDLYQGNSNSSEPVCNFDEKSDIWTIGILAFELYFKFPPFGSQCHLDEEKVMHNIRSTHWSDRVQQEAARDSRVQAKLLSMSPEFKAFLSACLKKKASLRPTAEALLEFPFLRKYNADVIASVQFLQQPRHQQGHKGFNHAAGPWQTPRPAVAAGASSTAAVASHAAATAAAVPGTSL